MIRGLPRGAVLLELLLLASPAAAQVVPEAMPGTGTVQPGPGPAGSPDAAEAPDGSAAPAAAMAPAVAPPPSPASSGTWTLEQARRAYLQARQLLHEQLHEEAQRLLADVLVRVPTWSLPKLALAQSLRAQSRNRDERERLLVEASAVDPENHQISYELGLVHEEADRRQEAIRCYRQAVARRPDMIHAQERLGVLLIEEGELDEARGHLEVVAAHQRGNLVVVSLLAVVFEGLHRYDEAEEQLKRLVELAPERAFFHARLAAFYQRHGKIEARDEASGMARRLLERGQAPRPKMRPLNSPAPKQRTR